jgi:RNA polymerase sigma factor (sigma-70 family)
MCQICYYVLNPLIWEGLGVNDMRDDIRAIWQQLAQRNDWTLISDDEEQFLDEAVQEFDSLTDDLAEQKRLHMAVQRAYGIRLYRGIRQRKERAAQELWLAVLRTALKRGIASQEAEELAQETIVRVIDKVESLRTPQSMIAWTFAIFRSILYRQPEPLASVDSSQAEDEDMQSEIADTTDVAEEVSKRVLVEQLQQLLDARLPNPRDKLVIMRIIIYDDKPRDVARDLGVPDYQIRNAKSRALAKLRADSDFIQLIRDLANDEHEPKSWEMKP